MAVGRVCGHHLYTEPEPPSARCESPIAADLEGLLLDCLAKDPKKRPPDARTLARRLRACEDADRWSEDEARAWWESFAAEPAPSVNGGGDDPTGQTMAVDLRQRLLSFR